MCAGLGWISDTKLQLVYTFAGLIYLLLTKVSVSRQRTGVFRYILAHFMNTVLHQKIGKKGLVYLYYITYIFQFTYLQVGAIHEF